MTVQTLKNKIKAYIRLTRFDKPTGLFLLLWPTLWALWLAAHGMPPFHILCIFVAGVIVMRPAGCIINDFADRHFDKQVVRTQDRPLATGEVKVWEAVILFVLLCGIGLILVLQLNLLTISLAVLALIVSSLYPFTKRFLSVPQLILGLGWYLAIPMAFAAVLDRVPLLGWLTYIAVVIWTLIFDTMYGLADKEDDAKVGIKSAALLFGKYVRFNLAVLQGIFLALLLIIGMLVQLSWFYYVAWTTALILSIYQQYLIKDFNPDSCISAFKNNHWLGLVMYFGIVFSI